MMTPTINFIGAGRLGQTIAKLCAQHQAGTILGVVNRSLDSAKQAVHFITQGQAYNTIAALPPADITFITPADPDIKACSQLLSKSSNLKKNSVIVHCAGSLPASVLTACQQQGCHLVSVHPWRTFANAAQAVKDFSGTYCAIEGEETASIIITPLIKKIGGHPYKLNSNDKKRYHLGAVMASNYLVTLYDHALTHLQAANIPSDIATHLTQQLMKNTLDNLATTDAPKQALTGPLKRGELSTLQNHLSVLTAPTERMLYKNLGLATLPLADLNDKLRNQITTLFTEKET